jgi:predicted MFS family arabinose efflux permease
VAEHGTTEWLYETLVGEDEEHGCLDLPESACREVPDNAARLVGAFTLTKFGDRIVDPKTTLAWLLAAAGAPGFATGLLVPIRESGSLIPQTALVGWVRGFERRKRVWIIGSLGQVVAVVAMALAGGLLSGLAAAVGVLAALAVFALSRSLSSISAKDVIGKTVPKGRRGSVTGIAASIAGLAALGAGVLMALIGRDAGAVVLAVAVGAAAALWLVAAIVFGRVEEYPSSGDETGPTATVREAVDLLRHDRPFRRFVVARSLLLVTALSPPFVVSLAVGTGDTTVAGLGPFVAATGLASLVGSPVWGRLADRSSRKVMAAAAGAGATIITVFLALRLVVGDAAWLTAGVFLFLALTHAGARMGRKTYVVDLGSGDERTRYVAVSNTVIGVVLLGTGLVGALAGIAGPEWALALLAAAGAGGAVTSLTLPEVEPG